MWTRHQFVWGKCDGGTIRNRLCTSKSWTRATSLLLLFMQQPWAVAGCTKIPVIFKHVHNGAAMRVFLLIRFAVTVSDDVSNFAFKASVRSLGRTITPLCRVAVFYCMNKGLDGVVGSAQSVGGEQAGCLQ